MWSTPDIWVLKEDIEFKQRRLKKMEACEGIYWFFLWATKRLHTHYKSKKCVVYRDHARPDWSNTISIIKE